MINIFQYQNYRTYLRDYYQQQKKAFRYFSYRYFSNKAGINASAFLYYVIENRRNLTKSSILKISSAIGHSREEAEYFENLVFFNQGKTIQEKTLYYTKIIEAHRPFDMQTINKDQFEFYAQWYHSVLRELVTLVDFQNDYKKLASMIFPPINEKQARKSIALLNKLGLIERDDDGCYQQTNRIIGVSPKGADGCIIEKFQQEMLALAVQSYDRFPRTERLGAATTFCISRPAFELFIVKSREFRKELLEIARLDDNPDHIIQLSMNLFPLARIASEDRHPQAVGPKTK